MFAPRRLKIGLSACFQHADPSRSLFTGKTLQYVEQSIAHWIMAHGAIALMVPFIDEESSLTVNRAPVSDIVDLLDGLVLQGGIDISPETYGQKPWIEKAEYDPIRDDYELALLRGFIEAEKPVLGICRGCQLLNVYFGGTLIQDIPTQWPGAILHNDTHRYDRLIHELHFMPGSRLSDIYGYEPRRVTSIHHQCVDQLGKGLVLEARSPIDLVPEGIRHTGYPFVMGVQWHPEFHMNGFDPGDGVLDSGPLMMAFLKAAARRAGRVRRLADGVARVRERASALGGR